ncbi:hypothetical protein FRC02_004927 [Tulasnella sp. 418]|nr:hypothetical protein FRC02_004927 [Tulasnella sp. 418]
MLAYHSHSEPPQLGLPDLIGLPKAAYLVANVLKIYAPELTVRYTPACCSDHQSFHEQGFPATQGTILMYYTRVMSHLRF